MALVELVGDAVGVPERRGDLQGHTKGAQVSWPATAPSPGPLANLELLLPTLDFKFHFTVVEKRSSLLGATFSLPGFSLLWRMEGVVPGVKENRQSRSIPRVPR